MSEANSLQYSHEQFPFAAIFEELTDWSDSSSASPLETYLKYRKLRRDHALTPCPDYASTSITSGGHARRPDLKTQEVIAANTETARSMVALMSEQGSLEPRATLLPVDLGYIPAWQQSDYIELWSLVISGPDLGLRPSNANATKYENTLAIKMRESEVDVAKMNDSALAATERAYEYFKFARAFKETAGATAQDATPVRKVISLVDPELSLGCQTERLLAKMLAIPLKRVVAVRLIDNYTNAIGNYKLRHDLDDIVRFGGTVVQVAEGDMLTLKTADEDMWAQEAELSL